MRSKRAGLGPSDASEDRGRAPIMPRGEAALRPGPTAEPRRLDVGRARSRTDRDERDSETEAAGSSAKKDGRG
jgi:hypothetical protein